MSEVVLNEPTKSVAQEGEGVEVLKGLSVRAIKFCELYAVEPIALKAGRLAGFAVDISPNYPYQLLDDIRIKQAIEYFKAVNASSTIYTPEKIKAQWAMMADFDILDCCKADYSLKNLDELTPDQRKRLGRVLVGLDVVEKNGKRYVKPKMAREQALIELGKLNRMYADDTKQGQGFELTINVGQQVSIHTPGDTEQVDDLGFLSITTEGNTNS